MEQRSNGEGSASFKPVLKRLRPKRRSIRLYYPARLPISSCCKPRIQQADRDESISDRMSHEPPAAIRLRLPRPRAALFLDRTHCFLCRKLVDINHCLRHRQLNFAYLYRYRPCQRFVCLLPRIKYRIRVNSYISLRKISSGCSFHS